MAKELIKKNRHVFVRETPDPQLKQAQPAVQPTKQPKQQPTNKADKPKTEQEPKATTQQKADTKLAHPKRTVAAVPDNELLDLTEDNILALIKKLGGKDVKSKDIVPYLKVSKEDNPQKKFPPTVCVCMKLVDAGKLTVAPHEKGKQFLFSVVP
jgi:hypothetical protein